MSGVAKAQGKLAIPVYMPDGLAVTTTVSPIAGGVTSTETSVAANLANVTLKAANTARIKLVIYNDDTAASIYVKEGATATSTSFTYKLGPGDYVFIDDYQGIVDGIWTAATGSARVTETV